MAALLALALILANRGLFTAELYETADPAANSLLVQDAKGLRLLTGNYSRIGFHHPGPAILYVLAAGELVFHDLFGWVRSPVAGQLIAVLFYSAAWTGLLLWVLSRILGSRLLALAAAGLFLAFTCLQDAQYVVSLWFPYLYYFPFAVFTASIARMASGHLDALWALVLSAAVLVHGHASFVAIAAIMIGGAIFAHASAVRSETGTLGWRRYVNEQAQRHRMQLYACAAIAVAFALPIALNTILNFPGDIPKYLTYGGGSTGNSWRESLLFVSQFWAGSGAFALLAGGLLLGLLWFGPRSAPPDEGPSPRDVRGAVWAVGLATLAVAFYAKTAIDLLVMKYTAFFYFAAVNFALVVAATSMLAGMVRGRRAAGIALLALSAAVIGATLQPSGAEASAEIPKIAESMREMGRKPVVLDLDSGVDWQRLWSTVVGVASYETRRGERSFCVNRNWHVLFTARYRCSDEELRAGTRLLVTARTFERTPGDGVIELAGIRFFPNVLVRVPHGTLLMLTEANAGQAARVLGDGWASPEKDFTWSTGAVSKLEVQVDRPGPFQLGMDVAAFLPNQDSTQQVEVRAFGRSVGMLEFSRAWNRGERVVTVPGDVVAPDGHLALELRVRSPISPAAAGVSADPRPLGVALRSLRLL